jgi:hypothetical protein
VVTTALSLSLPGGGPGACGVLRGRCRPCRPRPQPRRALLELWVAPAGLGRATLSFGLDGLRAEIGPGHQAAGCGAVICRRISSAIAWAVSRPTPVTSSRRFTTAAPGWPGLPPACRLVVPSASMPCAAGIPGDQRLDPSGERADPSDQGVDPIQKHPRQPGVMVTELTGQRLTRRSCSDTIRRTPDRPPPGLRVPRRSAPPHVTSRPALAAPLAGRLEQPDQVRQ